MREASIEIKLSGFGLDINNVDDMPTDVYVEMGRPEVITVTVEAGDILNK